MKNKQQLKKNLIKILEETELFSHIRIRGDLDYEDNSLIVEYYKNPNAGIREFNMARNILEKKLRMFIETYYSDGIEMLCKEPDKKEKYKAIFTHKPIEGMSVCITENALNNALNLLSNKYIFKE